MTDVHEHLVQANTCVVAFASGGGDFSGGVPHYEFGRSLGDMGVAYVLMRDSTGFSHLLGVAGIGDTYKVIEYILRLALTYDRVITIGLSVGALAAIHYGVYGAVDEVIALSPFTALGADSEAVYGLGWRDRCSWSLAANRNFSPMVDLLPLRPHIERNRPRVRAFVSDGEGTTHDWHHADRVGVREIALIPGASHSGLGKLMRDSGLLESVILGQAARGG